MFRILVTAVLLSFTILPPAQGQELTEINLYGGLSAPVGDFSDDSGSDAGYASIGFGVMGEYVQPLGSPGLGLAISASLLVNGADDDFIGEGADVGRYFIVPAMGGLRYRTEFSPTLDGYGVAQAGLTAARGPSGEVEVNGGEVEFTSGIATSFGFGFGGGLIFNDRINITLRYLILGEPEFEYEIESPGGDTETEAEVKMNVVQVMIGIPIGN